MKRIAHMAGFTLIELLIASSIFAVLAGALFMVFSSALRLRERAYETFEDEIPAATVLDLLRRDLGSMAIPSGTLAGPIYGTANRRGNAANDYIEFHTSSGVVLDGLDQPWGEMQRVAYYLEAPQTDQGSEEQGMELVREVQRNLLSAEELTPEIEPILSGVDSLEISYLSDMTWYDEWDSENNNQVSPQAVRVRIDFVQPPADKPPRHPLDLVCEIAAQTSATLSSTSSSGSVLTGTSMGGTTQ